MKYNEVQSESRAAGHPLPSDCMRLDVGNPTAPVINIPIVVPEFT